MKCGKCGSTVPKVGGYQKQEDGKLKPICDECIRKLLRGEKDEKGS